MNYRIDALVTQNKVADATQAFVMQLSPYISAMSFVSNIQGGYLSAVIMANMPDTIAWDLLANKLGMRVVFVNPHAANTDMICWEGMLYAVTIDDGTNVINRSMANVYNQIRVIYSTITFDGSGNPIFGQQVTTADANDTASQALYGIRELQYIIGGSDATNAAALRDTMIAKYNAPLTVQQSAKRGANATPQNTHVIIECAGAWETLDKRIYVKSTTANANIDVSVKACLATVAQFANADQSNVAANMQQRTQYAQGNITAQVYLNGMTALGGPNNRRFYFEFLEYAKPYYIEEPTAVAYRARRYDPASAVYDATTGAVVPPWLVLPGRIISYDDLIPDAVTYSTTLGNPRAFLIGETRFTAPNSLELVPYVNDPMQLQLAKMGLSQLG